MTDKVSTVPEKGPLSPDFLKEFPEDARLVPLVDAYLAGNYSAVRVGAPKLAKEASEPEVQRAAAELVERITPHPMLRWMYLATLALIVAVGLYWMRKS